MLFYESTAQEGAAQRAFYREGMVINFVAISHYMGAFAGLKGYLETWITPCVEKCTEGVLYVSKVAIQHPHMNNANMGFSLQL